MQTPPWVAEIRRIVRRQRGASYSAERHVGRFGSRARSAARTALGPMPPTFCTTGTGIDLNQPMDALLATMFKHGTRLLLSSTIVVARDIVHARFKEQIDKGGGIPDYLRKHAVAKEVGWGKTIAIHAGAGDWAGQWLSRCSCRPIQLPFNPLTHEPSRVAMNPDLAIHRLR